MVAFCTPEATFQLIVDTRNQIQNSAQKADNLDIKTNKISRVVLQKKRRSVQRKNQMTTIEIVEWLKTLKDFYDYDCCAKF
jgi:hypothetical protein